MSSLAQVLTYQQLEYLESVDVPLDAVLLQLGTKAGEITHLRESDALDLGISILNLKTGRMIAPEQLTKRTRSGN